MPNKHLMKLIVCRKIRIQKIFQPIVRSVPGIYARGLSQLGQIGVFGQHQGDFREETWRAYIKFLFLPKMGLEAARPVMKIGCEC